MKGAFFTSLIAMASLCGAEAAAADPAANAVGQPTVFWHDNQWETYHDGVWTPYAGSTTNNLQVLNAVTKAGTGDRQIVPVANRGRGHAAARRASGDPNSVASPQGGGTSIGQPNIGIGQPNTGIGQPNVGIGQPNIGIGKPNTGIGKPNTGIGQPPNGIGRPSGGIGQPPKGIGQPNVGIGRVPVGVGQVPNGIGRPSGGIGQPPTGVGKPNVGSP